MNLDFDMGRYAAFVWPAYLISAAVIGGLIVDSLARARRWRRETERLQADQPRGADLRDGDE